MHVIGCIWGSALDDNDTRTGLPGWLRPCKSGLKTEATFTYSRHFHWNRTDQNNTFKKKKKRSKYCPLMAAMVYRRSAQDWSHILVCRTSSHPPYFVQHFVKAWLCLPRFLRWHKCGANTLETWHSRWNRSQVNSLRSNTVVKVSRRLSAIEK